MNHLKSLRNEKYKHEAELSDHVWNLKKGNRQFSIRWAIVKQIPPGRHGKAELQSVPRGKANEYVLSANEQPYKTNS